MYHLAELVAANRTSSIAGGLVAFIVVAVGFLIASGLWLAYRVHWEKTRWAVFVEDTATPVRVAFEPASAPLPSNPSWWPFTAEVTMAAVIMTPLVKTSTTQRFGAGQRRSSSRWG